jgi:hypothetical protein
MHEQDLRNLSLELQEPRISFSFYVRLLFNHIFSAQHDFGASRKSQDSLKGSFLIASTVRTALSTNFLLNSEQ